ncbi:hypothetical protein L204_100771 [Cryptococcus depauperatus]|nr:hypothetical protein L204_01297 [Cryptococcus depauperatus CBS 7855]
MLELLVVPRQGNAGGRSFPSTGHLGVSPVILQGKIATKVPVHQTGLFPVKRIYIRVKCVETRAGGAFGGELCNTLWEQTEVFVEACEGDYLAVGEWSSSFKIAIPVEAASLGRSTMCIREYKVAWKMDAVVEHKPIAYVGNSIVKGFVLDLQRYQTPAISPPSPPLRGLVGSDYLASKVDITMPHGVFGPGDEFSVPVHIWPDHRGVVVKKVAVVLERTIELAAGKARRELDSAVLLPKRQQERAASPSQSKLSSILRRSLSPRPPHNRSSGEFFRQEAEMVHDGLIIRDKICEAVCQDVTDTGESYYCSVSMALPRRTGKWALGETHHTGLVSMSFQLRTTVTLKGDRRPSTSKVSNCALVPIVIASTSMAERSEAFALARAATRKQRRLSGKELYLQEENASLLDSEACFEKTPVLSPVNGAATDVKPILLSPLESRSPLSQSVSFVFPSLPPHHSPPSTLLPIHTLLNPEITNVTLASPKSHLLSPPPSRSGPSSPPDNESNSILQRSPFIQGSGRRISATNSEEEEVQPWRSRQKRRTGDANVFAEFERPSLPSLDALGLGLPPVPDDKRPTSRRPKTAPMHSTFAMSDQSPLGGAMKRAMTSAGLGRRSMTSASMGKMKAWREGETFAFVMSKEKTTGLEE